MIFKRLTIPTTASKFTVGLYDRAKMEYRITDKFISFGFFIDLNQDGYAE